MSIRPGNKNDKDDYLRVQLTIFPRENRKMHEKYINYKIKKKELLVLEVKDRYVGHLTFSKLKSSRDLGKQKGYREEFFNKLKNSLSINKEFIYIEEFGILNKFQGKGYGSELIKMVEEMSKIVVLDTSKDNKQAINFYQKRGYEIIDEIDDELILSKS
jgi:ribosomal protein S18 acetylase RimI-like enzyme